MNAPVVLTLGELSHSLTSGSRGWGEYIAESGSRFLGLGNLHRESLRLDLQKSRFVQLPEKLNEGRRTSLKSGDIMISITAELGMVAFIDETPETESFVNQHVALLRVKDPRANNKFIAYYFCSDHGQRTFEKLNDAGAKAGLNLETIRGFPLLLPPVEEQHKIARILGAWDRALERLDALLAAKTRRKRALMQSLLTGRRRLPGFSAPWVETRLGHLFTERSERGRSGLPLLSITATRGVIPRDDLAKRDTSNADKSLYLRIAPGDIGYNTMRMWQGVSALSTLEGIISPAYTVCTPGPKVNGRFAAHLFKLPRVVSRFHRYSQGLVDDTLNLKFDAFSVIHVTLPDDVTEQRAIARVLDTCDREVALLRRQQDALAVQKRGLMQRLLTGKIRVQP